jgi:hypothetical protein
MIRDRDVHFRIFTDQYRCEGGREEDAERPRQWPWHRGENSDFLLKQWSAFPINFVMLIKGWPAEGGSAPVVQATCNLKTAII